VVKDLGVTGIGNNGEGTARESTGGSSRDGDLGALAASGLRLLLAKVRAVLWTTDLELRVTSTMGSGLASLGLRPGDGVGLSLYEYLGQGSGAGTSGREEHRSDAFPPVVAHLGALRGEARDFEHDWNGRRMSVRIEPLRGEDGALSGLLGLAIDVTDQRELERATKQREDELREARKHEPLRRLSRTRLSELADVLTAILGLGDRLSAGAVGHPLAPEAERLSRMAVRGAGLLRELRDGAPETPEREARTPSDLRGLETILLVDDEPQVRGFVRRALEEYGYRVLDAGQVDEALSIGGSYDGQIHLLLTDVVLPGMSGPQLAARLAPLRPEMRILYMTGYADDAIVHRGVLSAGQSLLVKPFTSLGLAHEVKRVLRI
jgi:CheY-like chemotaxis protein